MLTYQLQQRTLKFRSNKLPAVPAELRAEIWLDPESALGGVDGPLRAILLDRERTVEYNANTGKSTGRPTPPPGPISASVEFLGGTVSLQGNKLRFVGPCEPFEAMEHVLEVLHYLFPAVLSQQLPDPVFPIRTGGQLGDILFNWEMVEARTPLRVLKPEGLNERAQEALSHPQLLLQPENRRLLAAFHYWHTASRLLNIGPSPWEFMAEVVLCLNKVLEVLFGDCRDHMRDALHALGYPRHVVEGQFVALTILRDQLDIAHPRLRLLPQAILARIYRSLAGAESAFRDLLERVRENVASGQFVLTPPERLDLTSSELRDLENTANIMEGSDVPPDVQVAT
ncbi:MAG: hypothetical protein ABI836_07845 [Gemmatimonadota bacterium]